MQKIIRKVIGNIRLFFLCRKFDALGERMQQLAEEFGYYSPEEGYAPLERYCKNESDEEEKERIGANEDFYFDDTVEVFHLFGERMRLYLEINRIKEQIDGLNISEKGGAI